MLLVANVAYRGMGVLEINQAAANEPVHHSYYVQLRIG